MQWDDGEGGKKDGKREGKRRGTSFNSVLCESESEREKGDKAKKKRESE